MNTADSPASALTVRDAFAALAMIGILGSRNGFLVDIGTDNVPGWAYRVADGMLAERAKKPLTGPEGRPISVLALGVRATKALHLLHCVTLDDVTKLTESDLRRLKNVGETTIRQIKNRLKDEGLSLLTINNTGAPQ